MAFRRRILATDGCCFVGYFSHCGARTQPNVRASIRRPRPGDLLRGSSEKHNLLLRARVRLPIGTPRPGDWADYRIEPIELPGDMGPLPSPAASYTEVDDAPGAAPPQPSGATLASGFPGLADQVNAFGFSFIPPDPIMAAGPNHLMGLVNASFGIFAKSGTLQKKIDATVWFQNVLPGKIGDCQTTALGCLFDPKVFYDHFANRWVMVWLASDRSTESWILVSVSDDSDPHGAWCNWALDGDLNGSTAAQNWSDYQGLGFDNQAVYIVPNQFAFGGGFDYAKIRILPKSTLYNTSCPAITWTDIWDLRFPQQGADAFPTFTIRPAVTFGTPGIEYLVANSYFSPPNNNFMVLYSLTSPLSNPSLSAVAVPVAPTNPPPDANQPGGGTPLIDVGDDRVMNAVYRDGSVWTAHSVASSTGSFARARYVRIDVGSGSTSRTCPSERPTAGTTTLPSART